MKFIKTFENVFKTFDDDDNDSDDYIAYLYSQIEAIDLEFKNLDWNDFDENDNANAIIINKTVHHSMSGYVSRFEYMRYDFSLTEKGDKIVVVDKSERVSGPIPSFMDKEIQDGNREYNEDEIEELAPDNVDKTNDTTIYDSWEDAIKAIDEEVEFE